MRPASVLELAAGTGAVTRRLSEALPGSSEIIATDLNPPMLEEAKARGTRRPVTWEQADAQQLPFENNTFDAVVCQFGAMFFPDKVQAFSEARRVLRPGGVLLFNVWDALRHNEFADPAGLVQMIADPGMRARIKPDQKLVFARDWPTAEARLKGTAAILSRMARLAGGTPMVATVSR